MIKKSNDVSDLVAKKALCFYRLLSSHHWLPKPPKDPNTLVESKIMIGPHAAIGGIDNLYQELVGSENIQLSLAEIAAAPDSNRQFVSKNIALLNNPNVLNQLTRLDLESTKELMKRHDAQAAGSPTPLNEMETDFNKSAEECCRQQSTDQGGYIFWISDGNKIKELDPRPVHSDDKGIITSECISAAKKVQSAAQFIKNLLERKVIEVNPDLNAKYDINYYKKGKKMMLQEEYQFYKERWGPGNAANLYQEKVHNARKWTWLYPLSSRALEYFTLEQRQLREEVNAARLQSCRDLCDTMLCAQKENGFEDGEEILLRDGKTTRKDVDVTKLDWDKVSESKGSKGYTIEKLKNIVLQLMGEISGLNSTVNKDVLRELLLRYKTSTSSTDHTKYADWLRELKRNEGTKTNKTPKTCVLERNKFVNAIVNCNNNNNNNNSSSSSHMN